MIINNLIRQLSSSTLVFLFILTLSFKVQAALVNYQFSVNGFSGGGILNASFQAEDVNLDGIIYAEQGEVVSFEYAFSEIRLLGIFF